MITSFAQHQTISMAAYPVRVPEELTKKMTPSNLQKQNFSNKYHLEQMKRLVSPKKTVLTARTEQNCLKNYTDNNIAKKTTPAALHLCQPEPFKINLIKVESPRQSYQNHQLHEKPEAQQRAILHLKQKTRLEQVLNSNDFYTILKKQILLDKQLTYWKNLVNKDNKAKILQLLSDSNISEQDLQISFEQFDPFSISRAILFSQDQISRLLKRSFEDSKKQWNLILNKFSESVIKNIYANMDFDQKGYVDLYDLTREICVRLENPYKAKDVCLIMKRISSCKQATLKQLCQKFVNQ